VFGNNFSLENSEFILFESDCLGHESCLEVMRDGLKRLQTNKSNIVLILKLTFATRETIENCLEYIQSNDDALILPFEFQFLQLLDSNDGESILCILISPQQKKNSLLNLSSNSSFRILKEEDSDSDKEDSESIQDLQQNNTSQNVTIFNKNVSPVIIVSIIVAAGILVLGITFYICFKLLKRKKQNIDKNTVKNLKRLERQSLFVKTTGLSPRITPTPEFSSISSGLGPKRSILLYETNAGMNPFSEIKAFQHLKLEENQENHRSSIIPEEVVLTNIENDLESLSSSRSSMRNTPRTLDFKIEFSIIDPPDSSPKMRKNRNAQREG